MGRPFDPVRLRRGRERHGLAPVDLAQLVRRGLSTPGRLAVVGARDVLLWESGEEVPAPREVKLLERIFGGESLDGPFERPPSWAERRFPGLRFDAEAFSRAITRAGLSELDLARRVGVCLLSIQNWTRGRSTPRSSLLLAACQVLGVDFDRLWTTAG